MTFIHVTTAEDRRNSEVWKKNQERLKMSASQWKKHTYRFKTPSRKGRLSETRAVISPNQTLHRTRPTCYLQGSHASNHVLRNHRQRDRSARLEVCIPQTISDKWSGSQGILRWRKTKRKFIDLQVLSRRDTKEVLLRQGRLDNRKPRQSNWSLQEDKAEKALAAKETTWALSRKPTWFPPTSTRQGWPLLLFIFTIILEILTIAIKARKGN